MQNQEFSDGTGLEENDFGARMQDPQLGLWHSIDPHCTNSLSWSTYNYTYDNPINLFDPNGMDAFDVFNKDDQEFGFSHYTYIAQDNSDNNGSGGGKAEALSAINKFAKDPNTKSAFSNISKDDFVMDLNKSINDPGGPGVIAQGNLGICGAAKLSKIFAEASPLDYVNAAIGLYQNGTATLNSMTLQHQIF